MLTQDHLLLGRYQLQRSLGNNAGRQTWLAEDQFTQQSVVLKLLAFSPQMAWDDLKLFEREAQVLQELNHPGIPRYQDYFSVDQEAGVGLCWFGLVQDYIPGHSLQALLKQGQRFTENQVRDIAAQVLNILIYLHSLEPPVLHRDIKPSNLILGNDDRVYLVDFGAVQNQAAMEGVTFTIVGTTGYAPLEQFWGRAVPASDLYALGATLIHLLTGTAPADLPQQNLRIQFSDRVSLNPTLVNWVAALTEPNLEQRYRSAQQALTDLQSGQFLTYPLQAIRSPANSRIKFWKSLRQLKLQIPGKKRFLIADTLVFVGKLSTVLGSSITMTAAVLGFFVAALVILITLIALFAILTTVPYYISTVWTYLTIGMYVVLPSLIGGGYFAYRYIFAIAKALRNTLSRSWLRSPFTSLWNYSLEADRETFAIEWRAFGRRVQRYRIPSNLIKQVQATRSGRISVQLDLDHPDLYQWSRDTKSDLRLLARQMGMNYQFGYRLTVAEQEWLVRSINDWLNQVN